MSRSVRKRPYAPWCGGSQKQDKRVCNRTMRRRNRDALHVHGEEAHFLVHDEALSRWTMRQDGSRHYEPWEHYRKDTYRWWVSSLAWKAAAGIAVKPYDEAKERWSWFRWVKRK